MALIISFVGSRKLAEPQFKEHARLFFNLCYRCAELGIVGRSGGALGADLIFEQAYQQAILDNKTTTNHAEIFVPWQRFRAIKDTPNPLERFHIIPSDPALVNQAEQMVRETHPAPNKLSQGAMKLHARNMNQVFGLDLNTPIDASICWTENGVKSGGTASNITLCEKNNIPVFNLGGDPQKVLLDIKYFLEKKGIIG